MENFVHHPVHSAAAETGDEETGDLVPGFSLRTFLVSSGYCVTTSFSEKHLEVQVSRTYGGSTIFRTLFDEKGRPDLPHLISSKNQNIGDFRLFPFFVRRLGTCSCSPLLFPSGLVHPCDEEP